MHVQGHGPGLVLLARLLKMGEKGEALERYLEAFLA
jgi:hypothetical protein